MDLKLADLFRMLLISRLSKSAKIHFSGKKRGLFCVIGGKCLIL